MRCARARLLAAAAVVALAATPAAQGHGGPSGYTATITSVTPAVPGLELRVLGGDDRLELSNETGKEIVILGYEGEPYLRFGENGVEVNLNSPAHYLNEDRFGNVTLPANADPGAAPLWKPVIGARRLDWHDHRIHWMSPQPPPQVREAPDAPHRVFTWKIPATAGGEQLTIAGTLDYAPPPGGLPRAVLFAVAPIVLLGVAGWAVFWRRTKRTGRSARR
jgi:hypothetical protein